MHPDETSDIDQALRDAFVRTTALNTWGRITVSSTNSAPPTWVAGQQAHKRWLTVSEYLATPPHIFRQLQTAIDQLQRDNVTRTARIVIDGVTYELTKDAPYYINHVIQPEAIAGVYIAEITGDDPWAPVEEEQGDSMLETLIKLYTAYMLQDVRSPMPHLAGPPGVGKSSVVAELAKLVGKKMHILNVARMSPLEIEGVQMPVEGNTRLHMLHSTLWTQLQPGDIVLLDEFMRGFPEVYNALLDIMTSREVAGYRLPPVFFVGASNSVAAYDKALEDRLLNIKVPDLRKQRGELSRVKQLIVDELGLHPTMVKTTAMQDLLDNEVLPMYAVLDQFDGKAAAGTVTGGHSVRNLIGQAKLRHVSSIPLKELIEENNRTALSLGKAQYVLLLDGRNPAPRLKEQLEQLDAQPEKLTQIQAANVRLNLQLIRMEEAKKKETNPMEDNDDDLFG